MYDRHHPKIINLNATYGDDAVLKLQFVGQQRLLHNAICGYLERTLVNLEGATNQKALQKALNAKASQQNEFKDLSFCSDQRIYELMVGESILGIVNRTKAEGVDVRLLWQSTNQQNDVRQFTHSESGSVDGAIGIFSNDVKGVTVLPIEAKSTMTNPLISPDETLEKQAIQTIEKKRKDFSRGPQINAVLILPNSPSEELEINLQPVANRLQDVMTTDSLGAMCLLTIHEDGLGLTTCILYGKKYELDPTKIKDFMGIAHYVFPSMEE